MEEKDFKRKLTTIMGADVVGYSRLMGDNDSETVKTLIAFRKAMSDLINQHNGRVVDSPGDNILAEFISVVDAVQCAVSVQREFSSKNMELSHNRKMMFRIGINLGDVIEEEDRIYGNGVNTAARLEGLADPGGICISKAVFDEIEAKLPLNYKSLGEVSVKNIAKPVNAYKVLTGPTSEHGQQVRPGRRSSSRRRRLILAGIFIFSIFLFVGGYILWRGYILLPSVASMGKMSSSLELSKGPSIAVLPFESMSGKNQDYFSDGLTENIITGISRCPKVFVIGRSSTFAYKGATKGAQQIARELGVEYIVEGSVQKTPKRVRINVQLIDGNTGRCLWADKYDRKLDDIFALQDYITLNIIKNLEISLTEGEQARLRFKGLMNLDAFLVGLKARNHFRRFNKEDNLIARQEIKKAIDMAPKNSRFYTLLAATYIWELYYGSSTSQLISFAEANRAIKKAISLNSKNSDAYLVLGALYLMREQYAQAIAACKKSVLLNPNGADAFAELGFVLTMSGKAEEAIDILKKAIRLNPIPPSYYFHYLGNAYRLAGEYEEAITEYKKAIYSEPTNMFARLGLTATYILSGSVEKAEEEASEVLTNDPNFSLEEFIDKLPFKAKDKKEQFYSALKKAGLK